MMPREQNILDSLAGTMSTESLYLCNLIGQDERDGYRKTLHRLVVKNPPSSWFDRYWFLDSAVHVLNFVACFAKFDGRLNLDQRADLFSFFIARLENYHASTQGTTP